MHFRHLVGDQDFKFTDEQIATLEKPVRLDMTACNNYVSD